MGAPASEALGAVGANAGLGAMGRAGPVTGIFFTSGRCGAPGALAGEGVAVAEAGLLTAGALAGEGVAVADAPLCAVEATAAEGALFGALAARGELLLAGAGRGVPTAAGGTLGSNSNG